MFQRATEDFNPYKTLLLASVELLTYLLIPILREVCSSLEVELVWSYSGTLLVCSVFCASLSERNLLIWF